MTSSLVDVAKEKDFSKYGQKFQLATLSLLIQDKSFISKIRHIIKPEYFDNTYCQWICETVLDQLEEFKSAPTFDDLKTIIETQLDKKAHLYLLTLNSIKEADLSRKEFTESEVQKFCFTKHALSSIEDEKDHILSGQFDKARETAIKKYRPIAVHSEEVSLKERFKDVFNTGARNPVPTPLPSLNRVSKEGPGAGDLCVVVAQSNFGKTNYLIATARTAAIAGKKVAYFTLETDHVQLMSRVLSGLVNVPQEYLKDHPERIENEMKNLKGEINFVSLKSIQARVDVIKLKLDEMNASGFFPELIIIDGLNQVKLPRTEKFTNSNDKFEYLAEEIRDLAKEMQLPIYVAFQANRGGFNVEYADEQNIGKAIEVYQVADWMVLFTQTPEMAEVNECFIQLLKNRLGPKGLMLRLSYDPNQATFNEIESVQRSIFFDKKNRNDIAKGLDTLKKRIEDAKKS